MWKTLMSIACQMRLDINFLVHVQPSAVGVSVPCTFNLPDVFNFTDIKNVLLRKIFSDFVMVLQLSGLDVILSVVGMKQRMWFYSLQSLELLMKKKRKFRGVRGHDHPENFESRD